MDAKDVVLELIEAATLAKLFLYGEVTGERIKTRIILPRLQKAIDEGVLYIRKEGHGSESGTENSQ